MEIGGFETWVYENIFYPHLRLHWGVIVHWNSRFPQFWSVCSNVSTGAPPLGSYRFFSFLFLGMFRNFSLFSVFWMSRHVPSCGLLSSFILYSCWAFSIWQLMAFRGVSVLWHPPLSCSHCLEYNSDVRLRCALEVRFSLWIFKNSVLFSYALCNICFLIEMIAFSPHAFHLFFFTVLLFGSLVAALVLE